MLHLVDSSSPSASAWSNPLHPLQVLQWSEMRCDVFGVITSNAKLRLYFSERPMLFGRRSRSLDEQPPVYVHIPAPDGLKFGSVLFHVVVLEFTFTPDRPNHPGERKLRKRRLPALLVRHRRGR